MKTTQRTVGWYHVMAAVTVMIWGTTFVATKVLIKYGLSPVDILFYRFLLAYICIWFFSSRVLLAKSWQDELRFVGLGLCGGSLYFVAENTALGMTLASNVSLIICTTPILTALLAPFFYKGDKLKARLIGGSLMALIGVGLVVFNGSFILQLSPAGDILTLIAALMWAFYCLLLRRMNTHYPTLFITRKVFFYGLVTLLPLFLVYPLQTDIHILFRPVVALNLLFLGVIASMLCY
ncbi:DMT family transporter, partial [Bacteroides fragilis]